jgi:acetolactate synthase-1/2/3 large subunit
LARQGLEPTLVEKALVSLTEEVPFVSSPRCLHISGDIRSNIRAVVEAVRGRTFVGWPANETSDSESETTFGTPAAMRVIDRAMPEGSVVLADAGNTGAHAIHGVRAPRGGRFLIAMGMAGMGYSFGAAIGAAFASGRRCTVLAGDGAFFMNGLDVHTALEHSLPITYVIFNNRAHGMCLVRERLLLGCESGYNTFRESHIGAGLRTMFPGLTAFDCRTLGELEGALAQAMATNGPAVIAVELAEVEVPPFVAFQQAIKNASPPEVRR